MVEAAVFFKPNLPNVNVIVNVPATLECYTHESGYDFLSFDFSTHIVSQSSRVTNLTSHGRGIKRNVTFTMTAGLNGTRVACSATGKGAFPQLQIVTIFAQEVPSNLMANFHVCRLPDHLFFNWNSVFTLNGFVRQYIIIDNHQNKTINDSNYSVNISGLYQASITVVITTAASQVVHGETKEISGM